MWAAGVECDFTGTRTVFKNNSQRTLSLTCIGYEKARPSDIRVSSVEPLEFMCIQ
jgi:hypothetical protein